MKLVPATIPYPIKDQYFTFHYYGPFSFTHQGSTWAGPNDIHFVTGLPWPAKAGSLQKALSKMRRTHPTSVDMPAFKKAEDRVRTYFEGAPSSDWVRQDFDKVSDWALANGIRTDHIILGEFGVLKTERKWKGADIASAARWIEAVRKAAEARGFPWAMWSYGQGMALTRGSDSGPWYPEIAKALGVRCIAPPSGPC